MGPKEGERKSPDGQRNIGRKPQGGENLEVRKPQGGENLEVRKRKGGENLEDDVCRSCKCEPGLEGGGGRGRDALFDEHKTPVFEHIHHILHL